MPASPNEATVLLHGVIEPPPTGPVRVDGSGPARALHDTAACRGLEHEAAMRLPSHTLMDRAGRGTARLVRALAPHARRVWVAAGPGNNGGDGLVAARCLKAAGLDVVVSLLADPSRLPDDAARAWREAVAAGVTILDTLPDPASAPFDIALDALLGLGATRAPEGALASAVQRLNAAGDAGTGRTPVFAVDLPTGLGSDTGALLPCADRALAEAAASPAPSPSGRCVDARWTLALLALKPGLFTAEGRARAGEVWFDPLGVVPARSSASAWLSGGDDAAAALSARGADAHKGRFGDLHVVGGDTGMVGAVHLCARAAARAGAGRVYVHPLASAADLADTQHPELMFRHPVPRPAAGDRGTWIAGCGGGAAIARWLPAGLVHAHRLVLDADALNAIAAAASLQRALAGRAARGLPTVLTPHPLEAARLLGATTAQVQADRLGAARALAGRTGACVVLKGSGTVIAAPGHAPVINPTGNGRLATAGTGDVLAGWLGGSWAAAGPGAPGGDVEAALACARRVAIAATWRHGRAATSPGDDPALPVLASELAERMARLVVPARGR
jgi:hydroxyethylthiazole kinase-like uncharacterized protein yjeF